MSSLFGSAIMMAVDDHGGDGLRFLELNHCSKS